MSMKIGCAQSEELIARSLSGNASADEDLAVREHAAGCAPCAERHARLRQVWSLMGRLPRRAPSELRRQETIARVRRPAFRPAWALAAAALIAVATLVVVTRPSPETPKPEAKLPPSVEPVRTPEPEPMQAREERSRVEATLEAVAREKAEKPVEVVQAPVVPAPRQPETEVKPQPKPEAPVARTPEAPKPEAPPAVPEEKKPAPARETLPTAAVIDRIDGEVHVLINGVRSPARADFRLAADEGIETVGKDSQAVLEFADGTRIVLGADTLVGRLTDKPAKNLSIARGIVAAQVARQPAGASMVFSTPHAEARVLGTRLSLQVAAASTRCEVKEGRVRFSRKEDPASVELGQDQFAVAGKGVSFAVRSAPSPKIVLRETFDRGRWQPAWTQESDPSSGLRLAVKDGSLSLHFGAKATPAVSPDGLAPGTPDATKKALEQMARVAALGSKKDWPRAAALEVKQAFALSNETPLRIRARLWQAQSDEQRIVALSINRAQPAQGLSLERRGALVQLWAEGAQAVLWKKEIPSSQEWETLELWLTKDRLAFRRDGLTLHAGPNPLKSKTLQIALGGHARAELAQDGEVRFDDVEVCWMTKGDFEEISK
jgi:ferric-dicitrate binding protein FerR (iron transport regulator)